MSNEEIIKPREYPLPGSTPWYNKRAREESERAIGRICMAFQRLEELVSNEIGRLISDDGQLGTVITAELSFRNRVGLLCSLYLYRLQLTERPEALKTLLAKLQRAEERRNTILHSYWIKSPVCGMLTRYNTQPSPLRASCIIPKTSKQRFFFYQATFLACFGQFITATMRDVSI